MIVFVLKFLGFLSPDVTCVVDWVYVWRVCVCMGVGMILLSRAELWRLTWCDCSAGTERVTLYKNQCSSDYNYCFYFLLGLWVADYCQAVSMRTPLTVKLYPCKNGSTNTNSRFWQFQFKRLRLGNRLIRKSTCSLERAQNGVHYFLSRFG